jgi:nucleoid-associated protein YgaU
MPSSPKMPETKKLFDEEKPSTLENAISVVLGLAVVLVIGAMIVNTIRNRNKTNDAANTEATTQGQTGASGTTGKGTYTVQAGDTLWSIAEKSYNDGFKWTEIQKANSLSSNTVEVGQKLILPEITGASTSSQPVAAGSTGPTGTGNVAVATGTKEGQTLSASTDKSYTVVRGDSLWTIAVKQYGNGNRWVDIAKANNLKNPSLIHAGNVFILP